MIRFIVIALFVSPLFLPAFGEEITGEIQGSSSAPSFIPQGLPFPIDYKIGMKCIVSLLDQTGSEVKRVELSAEGISLEGREEIRLSKGRYQVVEKYIIIAATEHPLLKESVLGGESEEIKWEFEAERSGIYKLTVSAQVTSLNVEVTGDLTLLKMGELGKSVSVELTAARNLMEGEGINYTIGYSIGFSRTSSLKLIAETEEKSVTFIVNGVLTENSRIVTGANVTVDLTSKGLKREAITDEKGNFKAVFSAPEGTILVEEGDLVKVSYKGFETTRRLTADDVSRGMVEVNISLDTVAEIESVDIDKKTIKNGESFTIKVVGEPGSIVTADLSQLDSTKPDPVELYEISPGEYELRTIVSPRNENEDGLKTIVIELDDSAGNSTTRTVQIELRNPTLPGVEISGEIKGELTSPFPIPKGFSMNLTYSVKTEGKVRIMTPEGDLVEEFDLPPEEGLVLAEHKSFKLEKGSYKVKESYKVTATPESILFAGWGFKAEREFEWEYKADKTGIYDLSINAVAADLSLDLSGDLRIIEMEQSKKAISIKLATTRSISVGDKIRYTAFYSLMLSKTTSIDLISEEEHPVTFVVSGAIIENGIPVSEAEVEVELVNRGLKQSVTTDAQGLFKAVFTAPQGTILAEKGDKVKVSYGEHSNSYNLSEEDVSKGIAMVNLMLDTYTWIETIEVSKETVQNGDQINITVIGEPGARAEVEMWDLDNTKVDPIPLDEISPGKYEGTLTISLQNTSKNGLKPIRIRLMDKSGNQMVKTVKIELKNPSPPAVIEKAPVSMKLVEPRGRIWAKVSGPARSVKAELTSPSGEKFSLDLTDPDGDGIYEAQAEFEQKGIYTVSIVVENVEGVESNPISFTVNTAPWDVNLDGEINIFDLVKIGRYYGRRVESPEDEAWMADVNSDGVVDLYDLVPVAQRYGKRILTGAPGLKPEGVVMASVERNGWIRFEKPIWALLSNMRPTETSGPTLSIPTQYGVVSVGLGKPFDRIKVPLSGKGTLWGVTDEGQVVQIRVILKSALLPNFPDPANPETWIPFVLSRGGETVISIYNLSGKLVRRIKLGKLGPGRYLIKWDGRNEIGERVSSGIYFIHLKTGTFEAFERMVIER